jgi:histidinol-phosphate aminotransferase
MSTVKHKYWIPDVNRVRSGIDTRHNKVRLDKNERVVPFNREFWNNLVSMIKQEHILAYPEIEVFYKKLAVFLGVKVENVMVTAGSDCAIKTVFELFVNPGDEVIILEPTFAMVDVYSDLYNAKKIEIGYDSNLNFDINKLINTINDKVSLVIIANPNSPTGTYIDNKSIKVILEKAEEHSIPVLIDEAYYGFCPHTAIDLLDSFSNLIISRTFSKAAGLAGLRIGYLVANECILSLLYKYRPMYEVNSIAVLFASKILDNWKVVEEYISDTDKGKRWLLKELENISLKTIDTSANFVYVDFGKYRNSILRLFHDNDILVRGDLKVKGFENYTRISVGSKHEMETVVDYVKLVLMEKADL